MPLKGSVALLGLCSVVALAQSTPTLPANDPAVFSSFFRLHHEAVAAIAQQFPAEKTAAVQQATVAMHVAEKDWDTLSAISGEVAAKCAVLDAERSAYLEQLKASGKSASAEGLMLYEIRQRQIVMSGVNRLRTELPRLSWRGLYSFINHDHRLGGQVSPIAFH